MLLAGDFDHHHFGGDIDDPSAENAGQFGDLAPLARPGGHLQQHQVALYVVLRADVVDADHGDDFFQLLADLLQHAVTADNHEGHS